MLTIQDCRPFFLSNRYLNRVLARCLSLFAWAYSNCEERKASENYEMKNSC